MQKSIIAAAGIAVAVAAGAAPAATPPKPALSLVTATSSVTLYRYPDYGVDLDLGAYLVASTLPFEIRVRRRSYHDPVRAAQVLEWNGARWYRPLPATLISNFDGMRKFLHIVITDAHGKTVVRRDATFCPNTYDTARTRPDAPDTSPYPMDCSANPFTVGAVWGIQAGWSSNLFSEGGDPAQLADGKYTATISVNSPYRRAFNMPATTKTVHVTVKKARDNLPSRSAVAGGTALPHGARPTGKPSAPTGPRPDLRSAPAWGIVLDRGGRGSKRTYLDFSATVWNAGPSPLVVDGFRQPGKPLMDAYQYFYDSRGKQVGYEPTGTMEWDPRPGHMHWHFTDFARYQLLDANKKKIVRSQKEAFCLANTDMMDFTVRGANWQPDNTDLHTACGDLSSLSVREVLEVGSGDTYEQSLPGQSFDITSLPNGTYYIEVLANPKHRLYETSTGNNVSLRKVILGGTAKRRTVMVPPYELVKTP